MTPEWQDFCHTTLGFEIPEDLRYAYEQNEGTEKTDKKRVEDYYRKASIDFEWRGGDQLTMRQVCPAVVRHPQTGEILFFNQIQLHHISCLAPDVRASLLAMFREEDLPRNVYYGDGKRIWRAFNQPDQKAYAFLIRS